MTTTAKGASVERPVEDERLQSQRAGGASMGAAPTALEADVLRLLRTIPSTIYELSVLCEVPRRDIEAAVEELRLRGEPIVADNAGLHLTEDPAELDRYVQQRRRRLVSIYAGNRALRRTLRRMKERDDLTLWSVA